MHRNLLFGVTVVLTGAVGCAHVSRQIAPPSPPRVSSPELAALPATRDEDWPMFRDDLERSGFAEGSSVGAFVEILWSMPTFNTTEYGAVKGSPSVVGDMLYCGTDTGRFIAARISDGTIVWQLQLAKTSHGIHGSPAIVGDVVYIGAYDGTVYAIERMTGLLLWRHKLGYQVGSSPAVVPQWGILFSSQEESPTGGGYIVALDARTGRELWQKRTLAHPHSSVAMDVQKGTLFVGDNRGVLYAFDAHSGRELWRREVDRADGKADIKTTPTVIPELGVVVFGSWSGKVYALDEASGRTVWEHDTGGSIMGSTAYLPSTRTVFAGSPRGSLYAIDAVDGSTRWTYHVDARIMSSPAVSGDGEAVVFGAANGNLYAAHADTGDPLWAIHIGGQVSGSPTLVGSRIYVTTRKGGLWALATHDMPSSD